MLQVELMLISVSSQNPPALEKDRYKIREAFITAPSNSLIVADYGQVVIIFMFQILSTIHISHRLFLLLIGIQFSWSSES